MKEKSWIRLSYAAVAALLLASEILIALFVHDSFLRPYGGDILVTVLLCAALRIIFLENKWLPLWVFSLSLLVEVAQGVKLFTLLGFDRVPFLRVLLGTTFSVLDVLCYAAGCMIFFIAEKFLRGKKYD